MGRRANFNLRRCKKWRGEGERQNFNGDGHRAETSRVWMLVVSGKYGLVSVDPFSFKTLVYSFLDVIDI